MRIGKKMTQRSANDIMQDAMPIKSNKKYNDSWNDFCEFLKLDDREPTEDELLQYFDNLKNNKEYASSTIWSVYSMINHKFQLLFGKKLQIYPRITILLKSYEAGYVRKSASVFSKDEILRFLSTAPDTGELIYSYESSRGVGPFRRFEVCRFSHD